MRYFVDSSIFVLVFNDGTWIDICGKPLNIRRHYRAPGKNIANIRNYPYVRSTKELAILLL